MAAPWRSLQVMADDLVDGQWAEPVEIRPWGPVGMEDDGAPDPNRPPVITTGVLVMPGAATTGEGAGSGFESGPVSRQTWLSITEHRLLPMKLHELQQGDRIYFPDRDEWYMVDYPVPSKTARPNIYLTRLQTGSIT
jgi:hypothetical protein